MNPLVRNILQPQTPALPTGYTRTKNQPSPASTSSSPPEQTDVKSELAKVDQPRREFGGLTKEIPKDEQRLFGPTSEPIVRGGDFQALNRHIDDTHRPIKPGILDFLKLPANAFSKLFANAGHANGKVEKLGQAARNFSENLIQTIANKFRDENTQHHKISR